MHNIRKDRYKVKWKKTIVILKQNQNQPISDGSVYLISSNSYLSRDSFCLDE